MGKAQNQAAGALPARTWKASSRQISHCSWFWFLVPHSSYNHSHHSGANFLFLIKYLLARTPLVWKLLCWKSIKLLTLYLSRDHKTKGAVHKLYYLKIGNFWSPLQLFVVFLSAMSLRRTSKDLNFLSFLLFFETKSWQKHQSLLDSNKLTADFNNINKEFLPKKILPKNPPKKSSL